MDKRDTLLIVDDMEVNRVILRSLFEKEYNVLEAENGEQALALLTQYQDNIEAVLLDLVMPIKNGYQVMEEMGRNDLFSKVSVIVITSDDTAENEVRAFDLGASDIIMKPFEPHVVKRRIQNIVELNRHRRHLEDLVEEQSASLRESNSIMIDTLSSVIEYRNLESGQHIKRIRMFTKILLEDVARTYQEYDLDPRKIDIITNASSMHDIGKIAIPDSILNKPGRLTKEEFEVMKTHTVKGCEILSGLDRMNDKEYLTYAYNICRYHHERYDGSGYPDGLKGENIPICAQVVAIADCYDALTTDRVYKKALPQDEAFTMIMNGECGVFSTRLLECFRHVREAFAELSQAYADGRSLDAETGSLTLMHGESYAEDAGLRDPGQMKYQTLLRYLEATVMEVDLRTGVCHMAYLADEDFETMRGEFRFKDAVKSFTENSVHPDDQEAVLGLLGGYMDDFFREGFMKRTRRYRVFCQKTGTYCWCKATVLRVDTENPRQRKAILVWQKYVGIEEKTSDTRNEDSVVQDMAIERLVGGICKTANDRYFTLVHMNKGFLTLVGYTEEEIQDRFKNHYIELVYPDDQEELLRQVRQQLMAGSSMELEYRVVAKDGRLLWILDKMQVSEEGGEEYFYSILLDVTQSREAQKELRLSLERHRIILEQSNDIIFEWNLREDTMDFSNNWEQKFGRPQIIQGVSGKLAQFTNIIREDVPTVLECMEAIRAGVPYSEVEFRMEDTSGGCRWYRARNTAQFDDMGKPYKAVGIITDIDDEKKTARELQDKIERDVLTKLYNRSAARKKIVRNLDRQKKGGLSAMLIIDVDDFKQINDSYGHMFGDAVLTELASQISSQFRNRDVVSRIGGDEFLVYMPDIPNREIAVDRATRMIHSFRSRMDGSLGQPLFSCSVGIAFSPDDGRDFATLFKHGDAALYQAKADGKNGCRTYDGDTMGNVFESSHKVRAASRIDAAIDSIEENSSEHLISRAFDILYEACDLDESVNTVLAMIGERFLVSRVWLFETDEKETYLSNTFEWHREGSAPSETVVQGFPVVTEEGDYRSYFEENGLFSCQNFEKLPAGCRTVLQSGQARSMLQCRIMDEGRFLGFIGFEDCAVKRVWTQEQMDFLMSFSRLFSVFLAKKRGRNQVSETAERGQNGN